MGIRHFSCKISRLRLCIACEIPIQFSRYKKRKTDGCVLNGVIGFNLFQVFCVLLRLKIKFEVEFFCKLEKIERYALEFCMENRQKDFDLLKIPFHAMEINFLHH